jgi:hypothetical protein
MIRWIAVIEKPDKPHFSKKIRRRYVFGAGKVVRHSRKIVLKVKLKMKKEVDRLMRAWTGTLTVPGAVRPDTG